MKNILCAFVIACVLTVVAGCGCSSDSAPVVEAQDAVETAAVDE